MCLQLEKTVDAELKSLATQRSVLKQQKVSYSVAHMCVCVCGCVDGWMDGEVQEMLATATTAYDEQLTALKTEVQKEVTHRLHTHSLPLPLSLCVLRRSVSVGCSREPRRPKPPLTRGSKTTQTRQAAPPPPFPPPSLHVCVCVCRWRHCARG